MPLVFVLLISQNIGTKNVCSKNSLSTPHRMSPSNSHSHRTPQQTVAHDPQDRITGEGCLELADWSACGLLAPGAHGRGPQGSTKLVKASNSPRSGWKCIHFSPTSLMSGLTGWELYSGFPGCSLKVPLRVPSPFFTLNLDAFDRFRVF